MLHLLCTSNGLDEFFMLSTPIAFFICCFDWFFLYCFCTFLYVCFCFGTLICWIQFKFIYFRLQIFPNAKNSVPEHDVSLHRKFYVFWSLSFCKSIHVSGYDHYWNSVYTLDTSTFLLELDLQTFLPNFEVGNFFENKILLLVIWNFLGNFDSL